MNKNNIEEDSNSLINKKRKNFEKTKNDEKLNFYNNKNTAHFLKLIKIANNVEKRDSFKYKLICPICKKKNLFNSLIFENLKEFILYLAYIFTFIPQSYKNCKLFFLNKDDIINFFKVHKHEKSFFYKKNTILICKECLIKKMNQKNFTNIFSSVFGCKKFFKKANKKRNNSSLKTKKIDINNKSNLNQLLYSEKKNIENDNLETTYTNVTNLNNKNQLSSPFNINQLNNRILKDLMVNTIENKNDNSNNANKINNNSKNNKSNINIFNIREQKNNEYLISNKILENFENTFNSIFQGFLNIIFEIRKFNIKISEKKNEKEYDEYINNLKKLKIELKNHIERLSIFQKIYSSEITRLYNIIPNQKDFLDYNIEINYIYEETKVMSYKFINSFNFFQTLLSEYLTMLESENK